MDLQAGKTRSPAPGSGHLGSLWKVRLESSTIQIFFSSLFADSNQTIAYVSHMIYKQTSSETIIPSMLLSGPTPHDVKEHHAISSICHPHDSLDSSSRSGEMFIHPKRNTINGSKFVNRI